MQKIYLFIFLFQFSTAYSQQDKGCANPMNVKTLIKGMNIDDSIITIKELLAAEELITENRDVQILSFTATLYPGNEVYEFSVPGTKFSDSNRRWFSKLRAGDAVYFSDIRTKIGLGVCLTPRFYRLSE